MIPTAIHIGYDIRSTFDSYGDPYRIHVGIQKRKLHMDCRRCLSACPCMSALLLSMLRNYLRPAASDSCSDARVLGRNRSSCCLYWRLVLHPCTYMFPFRKCPNPLNTWPDPLPIYWTLQLHVNVCCMYTCCVHVCMYIYIYIYISICTWDTHMCTHVY